MLGGIIFSAAAPSFKQASPSSPSSPFLPPSGPASHASSTHPQKILSSGAQGSTTPQPQCPGPTALLPAARQPSAGPWQTPGSKLQSSSPAEGKESGQHHRPEGGPHQDTSSIGRTFEHNSPGAPGASPAPFFGADLVSATGLCPQGPWGVSSRGAGRS